MKSADHDHSASASAVLHGSDAVSLETFKSSSYFSGPDKMVMPLALLEKSMDKRISLLLKDSRVLEGKLAGYDDYMNMVLDETEERTPDQARRLGTVVLRGNNVVSIAIL